MEGLAAFNARRFAAEAGSGLNVFESARVL
jgi:hypothetical protein